MRTLHNQDFWAGLLCLASGLLTIVGSSNYRIGTLEDIGPAAYPMVVGVLLAVVGVIIIATGKTKNVSDVLNASETQSSGTWNERLRLWVAVFGGVLLFIYLGRNFGFIPATFALLFISTLGDKRNSFKTVLILSVLATAAVIFIFHYLIGLQFSLLSWG